MRKPLGTYSATSRLVILTVLYPGCPSLGGFDKRVEVRHGGVVISRGCLDREFLMRPGSHRRNDVRSQR